MRIFRWIISIPAAFVIFGLLFYGAAKYIDNSALLAEDYRLNIVIRAAIFLILCPILPMIASAIAPAPKKYAAIIVVAIYYALLLLVLVTQIIRYGFSLPTTI
jgi:hypothetical protein